MQIKKLKQQTEIKSICKKKTTEFHIKIFKKKKKLLARVSMIPYRMTMIRVPFNFIYYFLYTLAMLYSFLFFLLLKSAVYAVCKTRLLTFESFVEFCYTQIYEREQLEIL